MLSALDCIVIILFGCILFCGCFNFFCNMWVCVCVGFVMCGCVDHCLGVLVICVLVFTVFRIVCTAFCIVFMYIYSYLLFL